MSKRQNDDGVEPIEDDEGPFFVKWDRDKTADLKITKVDTSAVDFNGDPCISLAGELRQPLDGHEIGEIANIGGGQTKLKRLIERGVNSGRIEPGAHVVIKRIGLIGRMLDFDVEAPKAKPTIDLGGFHGTPRDEKPPF